MGKSKPAKEIITIDLESPVAEGKHQISRHRSCWQHILATLHARKKRLTKKDQEAIDGFKVTAQCFLNFPCRERSNRTMPHKNAGLAVFKLNKRLDSRVFEVYFELLWRGFSDDRKISFEYLDCQWFSLYKKPSYKSKVLTWIKKKNIFSKKYVFVPIVIWRHWNLLVFCNFDESLELETRTRCMVLLDSLQSANSKQLKPDIRKFVSDIYKAEDRPETPQCIRKIPLLIPQVPQQRNDWECGNFVLHFIKLFMDSAPENFSMEGYPYFMTNNWFTPEGLDCFCEAVHSDLVATGCSYV